MPPKHVTTVSTIHSVNIEPITKLYLSLMQGDGETRENECKRSRSMERIISEKMRNLDQDQRAEVYECLIQNVSQIIELTTKDIGFKFFNSLWIKLFAFELADEYEQFHSTPPEAYALNSVKLRGARYNVAPRGNALVINDIKRARKGRKTLVHKNRQRLLHEDLSFMLGAITNTVRIISHDRRGK